MSKHPERDRQKALKKLYTEVQAYDGEWYNLRPIMGNANWAWFYLLLGGREVGKSYAVTNFFVDQYKNKGIPFTWLRLTERQAQKLLQNNAEKLVDPDIRRKYNLDLRTNGNNVYEVKYETVEVKHKDGTITHEKRLLEKKLMARVYAISTFYTDKGSIFDKDFLKDLSMRYNIAIDEFQREKGEKNTFDIMYSLVNQLENLVRSTKERIKIFFLGNTLEEASDVLCAFNFIPEQWGTFKLKSKRAVIQNIAPSEKYKARRAGTIADILMPNASTFTNKIDTDKTLVYKKRLRTPTMVIKFSKSKNDWYTVWNSNVIAKYKGEKKPVVAMRPYLDEPFSTDQQKNLITLFDQRCFMYQNLITFKQFQKEIELLKPRK